MELQTKIGTLQVREEDVISFPTGILGFADIQRYVLVEQQDSVFSFLQAVDEPDLTFVIIIPELVCCAYSVELKKEEIELLEFASAEDGQVYAIVTVPENVAEMTVNLQAPVVINVQAKLGAQLILADGPYHTKHNVLAEMQKNAFFLKKQQMGDKTQKKAGEKAEQVRESV